jgi:hypothetical protein
VIVHLPRKPERMEFSSQYHQKNLLWDTKSMYFGGMGFELRPSHLQSRHSTT